MNSLLNTAKKAIVKYAHTLLVLLAFAIMVVASYLFVSETESRHLKRTANNAIFSTEASIKSDMLELETLLGVASETISKMLASGESRDAVNEYILFINKYVAASRGKRLYGATGIFGVFDVFDGVMLIGYEHWTPPDDYYETDRLWYTGAIKAAGEVSTTEPYLNAYSNETTITLSRRIFDEKGSALGIVCLNIELERIQQYVVSTQFAEDGYGFLLSENMIIIAHPDPAMVGLSFHSVKSSGIATFIEEFKQKGSISEVVTHDYRGVQCIVFVQRLQNGWYMGAVTPTDRYFHSTKNLALTLTAFGLICAALLIWVLLRVSAEKTMTDERMKIMFNATPLVAYIFDKNYRIIDCNQNAVKLFDLSSKQEFCNRFYDLLPEYQPNGRLTAEMGTEFNRKILEEGSCCFEWMYRKFNGELVPCEITCTRVKYKNDFTIVGYMRDLREQKKMMAVIQQRALLLDTVNNAAAILLSNNAGESFENSLLKSFELIGRCLDVDRVQAWRNEEIDDDLHFALRYEWLSDYGKTCKSIPHGLHFSYSLKQEWKSKFLRGGNINAPLRELPEEDRTFLEPYGIKSLVILPMFLDGDFWGFFSIDDCRNERTLTNEEISILDSAGLMMTNAINRNIQALKEREANEYIQAILDAAPLAITMWNPVTYELINCNLKAINMVGMTDKKLYMEKFAEMATEYQANGRKTSEMLVEIFDEAMRNGICRHDWTHKTLDGEAIPFQVNAVRLKYMDDYVIISYAQDMREINAAIEKMRKTDEFTQVIFNAMPLACQLWDKDLHCVMCNDEAVRVYRAKDKEDFLNNFFSFSPEHQPDGRLSKEKAYDNIMKAFNDGYCRFEWLHIRGDGEEFPGEITIIRAMFNGEPALIGYTRDLSDEKAMLNEKHRAEVAEESNKAKSGFLARVSHEIRTPMNAILGIAEIQLQDDMHQPLIKEAFERIYNSGNLLLGIINDILDLSKIEAGKLMLTPAQYDIASLIHDTVQLIMMRYETKPIEFVLDVTEDLPLIMVGDELRIKQVLNNLLSNAFKYTEKGTVKMTVYAEPADPEDTSKKMLTFIISDTGQGMTSEQVEKLGIEYSRFNMEANRKTEGTGLGMNITRNLLQLMDGTISVKSTPGEGSIFTVRLPQNCEGIAVVGKEIADNLMGLNLDNSVKLRAFQMKREYMPYGRVLIVDDVETNLYVARGLLAPYGLSVETVLSGFEAIDKIKEGLSYDIIFMDHMMPRMDGIEATKIIRDLGYSQPVVALTANAIAGQASMFMENGFDDFISKPIDIRQLNMVLNKLIRDKYPADVVKAARKEKSLLNSGSAQENVLGPELAEIFARDAKKAVSTLEAIYDNKCRRADDLSMFVINIHAMKSALANVGEAALSAEALQLEMAGREKNISLILSKLPSFLEKLRTTIKKLEAKVDIGKAVFDSIDSQYLKEKLLAVKEACAAYDKKSAKAVLAEIRKKTWPKSVNEQVYLISSHLLHSDFEEAVQVIDVYVRQL